VSDPLRRTVQFQLMLAPLTAHFIRASAKRLGVSNSEFGRRIFDAALVEYVKAGIYELPAQFKDLPFIPFDKPRECGPDMRRTKTAPPKRAA
jgi:hypothetical protein